MATRRSSPRGPWGGALLSDVRARVSKGWPSGLTTLTGEDRYHLDLALLALLDHLAPDRKDSFSLSIVAEGRASAADVVSAACSLGMFAPRRVVLVRDAALLDGAPDALEAFSASPPAGAFLLVVASKLDRKRKLHQALAAGNFLDFRPPETAAEAEALVREIVAMGKARGQALDRDGAAVLAEGCRGDLLRVGLELDRLRDWTGAPSHRWTREELESRLATSPSVSGWAVGDALVRRNRGEALSAIRRVTEDGTEPIPVVGGLAWRARVFLAARARVEAGEGVESVVAGAGAWGWSDPLREGLSRWSLAEAARIPERLLRADRQLKSRGIPGSAVLESAVEDLIPAAVERR